MQIDPGETALDRMAGFIALLAKWNKTYNLTAVRDPADMVSRHLLDSLAVAPFITSGRLLDVSGNRYDDGADVHLWEDAAGFNQVWWLDPID